MILDGVVVHGCTRTGATASPGANFQFPVYDDQVIDVTPGFGLFKKGDISFLSDVVQNNAAGIPALVTPTGFTNIGAGVTGTSLDGFGMRGALSYKIWAGTEAGTIVAGMSGLGKNRKNLLTFRMSRPVQTISILNSGFAFSTGDPGAITATASGQVGNVLVLGWAHADNAIASWSFSNAKGTDYFTGSNAKATDATGEGGSNFIRSGYSYYPYGDAPLNSVIDIADLGDFNILMQAVLGLT